MAGLIWRHYKSLTFFSKVLISQSFWLIIWLRLLTFSLSQVIVLSLRSSYYIIFRTSTEELSCKRDASIRESTLLISGYIITSRSCLNPWLASSSLIIYLSEATRLLVLSESPIQLQAKPNSPSLKMSSLTKSRIRLFGYQITYLIGSRLAMQQIQRLIIIIIVTGYGKSIAYIIIVVIQLNTSEKTAFKNFIEAGAKAPKGSNRASLIIIGSINLGAMLNHALCITAITAFLFLLPAQTRLYADGFGVQIFRRQGCWVFVDRLHLDPGHMSVNARLKLHLPTPKHNAQYNLQLVAIPESIWQRAVQSKCNIHSLTPPQQEEKRQKEVVFEFELTPNNGYATRVVSQLEVPAEQSYNFVLRDCSRVLVDDGYGRQSKIELTLDMRNNESHLSSGEHSYGWLLPLLLVVGAGTLWLLRREKEEQGDNWIKLSVKMSMAVGLGSILFKYLGYLVYAHGRGVEHGFFEVVYLLLQATSDSILMVLLMVLSFGWTVTFKKAQDFGLYVPLACMLGLVNILMTMLNKISDGQHDKYHMYDSIPAYIMIAFRLVGLVVVVVGLARTWLTLPSLDGPGGHKLSSYFWQLAALALLYMAFVPIGFLGVGFLGSRHRKEAMFFAMELARFALSAWLAWLAGCKKSAYRAILDQSFMEKAEKFY